MSPRTMNIQRIWTLVLLWCCCCGIICSGCLRSGGAPSEQPWEADVRQGYKQAQTGDYRAATESFARALKESEAADDLPAAAANWERLGEAYGMLGEWMSAREAYRRALELNRNLRQDKAAAGNWVRIAEAARILGEKTSAAESLHQARLLAEAVGDAEIKAMLANEEGLYALSEHRLEEAAGFFIQAVNLSEKSDKKTLLADSYYNLAAVKTNLGDLKSAVDFFGRALALDHELDNRRAVAFTLKQLGRIAIKNNDMNMAEEYLARAAQVNEGLKAYSRMESDLKELGEFLEAKGEAERARKYYLMILNHYKKQGDQEKTRYWEKKLLTREK